MSQYFVPMCNLLKIGIRCMGVLTTTPPPDKLTGIMYCAMEKWTVYDDVVYATSPLITLPISASGIRDCNPFSMFNHAKTLSVPMIYHP